MSVILAGDGLLQSEEYIQVNYLNHFFMQLSFNIWFVVFINFNGEIYVVYQTASKNTGMREGLLLPKKWTK